MNVDIGVYPLLHPQLFRINLFDLAHGRKKCNLVVACMSERNLYAIRHQVSKVPSGNAVSKN